MPDLTPEQQIRRDKLDRRDLLITGRLDYAEANHLFSLICIAAWRQIGCVMPDVTKGDTMDQNKFIAERFTPFTPFGEWMASQKRALDGATECPLLQPLPPVPEWLERNEAVDALIDRVYKRVST